MPEVSTGRLLHHESRPTEFPIPTTFVRLSPDGRWLWVETGSENSWVYDLKGDRPPERFVGLPFAISPDSCLFAHPYPPALQRGEWALGVHLGRGGSPWMTLANRDGTDLLAIEFSHDGRYVAWGSPSGAITVADLQTLREQVEAFEEELRRK